jgi:hypothetical protein
MTLDLSMHRQIVKIVLNVIAISLCNSIVGCNEKGGSMSQRPIEQVQQEYTDQWMAIPGVEGTAIDLSNGKPCITVFSSVDAKSLKDKIPSTVEGYPVIIEKTGVIRALE